MVSVQDVCCCTLLLHLMTQCHLAKVDQATSESERRLTSLIVAGPSCRVPWSPGLFTR
jgi:hypothetical protein